MALVKCEECGKEVSKNAEACPECGNPIKKVKQPRKQYGCGALLVVLFVVYLVSSSIDSYKDTKARSKAAEVAVVAAAKAEKARAEMTEEEKFARISQLESQLATIPAAEAQENLDKYRELVKLDPANPRYTEKVDYYRGRLARLEKIKAQFSSWSGAHRALEKYIKKNLKDPDSYEHIETRYGDQGDHIKVLMQYRAKNSFGGYAIEAVTARCTVDGDCTVL